MKRLFILLLICGTIQSCVKLDLNPLSESATGNFYSDQTELEMAVNDMYRLAFWQNSNEEYSDDLWNRGSGGNAITYGTLGAEDGSVETFWDNAYKVIGRVNVFLERKDNAADNTPESVMQRLEGEARLARAYQYSRLITHFGDVPFLTEPILLEEAYGIPRTDKDVIMAFVFDELDLAAELLPVSYSSGELKRVTKGAALGMKARTALYMGEWAVARDAAAAVMALADDGIYSLHPNYRQLFLAAGALSNEIILSMPRSDELGFRGGSRNHISRNNGGYASVLPTWEMMDTYECVDGLPIDQSPLYDPSDPFANRDPRLVNTIVEFGTPWLGFSYQPHPDSTQVWSYRNGRMVSNKDSRGADQFASYTGLLLKKGIDESWLENQREDNDRMIMRYAEMLLTYAEAKIELNEIDETLFHALNQVRARAYGVSVNDISEYPAVTTTNVNELRTLIKRERRVELSYEGLRYMDLIRWRLAEKALGRPLYGLPDPANQDRDKWPFAGPPMIDADGIPNYSGLGSNVKQIAERNFDASRQYLWPIPASERRINDKLTQNPNY